MYINLKALFSYVIRFVTKTDWGHKTFVFNPKPLLPLAFSPRNAALYLHVYVQIYTCVRIYICMHSRIPLCTRTWTHAYSGIWMNSLGYMYKYKENGRGIKPDWMVAWIFHTPISRYFKCRCRVHKITFSQWKRLICNKVSKRN